ncbi:hypothetical protein FHW69_002722 [Luteibacter sp. Sphag1AF]|nr:hypothetical protein [Luteibacter sp. Sphag1AF]MBB3228087.1 hypothetical protein [Luteibacter sp. Sphag1AF]
MKRLILAAAVLAMTIAVSGCIVVPARGGYYHGGYWGHGYYYR